MQCEDDLCKHHIRDIDVFYSAITNCLHGCIKQCIPVLKLHNDNFVAGWNDYVSHYYNISRTDFKWWVAHNSYNICFVWTYVSGQHIFLVCSPMTHFIAIYCVFYMI